VSAEQVEQLAHALELSPENPELRLLLAEVLADAGRQGEAALSSARPITPGWLTGARERLDAGALAAD
jgi:hypothetical protein